MVAIIAAIAIPNLMKSRESAHGASAAAIIRTLITVQISYSASFPETGYASDLASLGPGPDGKCGEGPAKNHACLADSVLACPSGTSGEWCTKGGYRYTTTATCKEGPCVDFVVVATPVDPSAGKKNFCATSDGVPRSKEGPPLTSPVTIAECQTWEPL
jgi:type II secretory pathway pseudopilin PulG